MCKRTIDNVTLTKNAIEAAGLHVGFTPESGTVFFPDCGPPNSALNEALLKAPVDPNNKVTRSKT